MIFRPSRVGAVCNYTAPTLPEARMGQQKFVFNGPVTIAGNSFSNIRGRAYTEPSRSNSTETQKRQLIEFAKREGYTSLSLAKPAT